MASVFTANDAEATMVAVTITKGDGGSIERQAPIHETVRGLKTIVSRLEGIPTARQDLFVEHDKYDGGVLRGETLADINFACDEPLGAPVRLVLWVGEDDGEPEAYSFISLPAEAAAIPKLVDSTEEHGHGNNAQCVVISLSPGVTIDPSDAQRGVTISQLAEAEGKSHCWQVGMSGDDTPAKVLTIPGPVDFSTAYQLIEEVILNTEERPDPDWPLVVRGGRGGGAADAQDDTQDTTGDMIFSFPGLRSTAGRRMAEEAKRFATSCGVRNLYLADSGLLSLYCSGRTTGMVILAVHSLCTHCALIGTHFALTMHSQKTLCGKRR
jgi:hypothetical protein